MNLDKLNIYSVLGLRQCHSMRPLYSLNDIQQPG